jgi:hypothetical protein
LLGRATIETIAGEFVDDRGHRGPRRHFEGCPSATLISHSFPGQIEVSSRMEVLGEAARPHFGNN